MNTELFNIYFVRLFNEEKSLVASRYVTKIPSKEEGMALALIMIEDVEKQSRGSWCEFIELDLFVESQEIKATRTGHTKWRYTWDWTTPFGKTIIKELPKLEQLLTSKSKLVREAVRKEIGIK